MKFGILLNIILDVFVPALVLFQKDRMSLWRELFKALQRTVKKLKVDRSLAQTKLVLRNNDATQSGTDR